MNADTTSDADLITVYSAPWCGHCIRLKNQLQRAGITYREVDVDAQPESLEFIASLNAGDWLIPTVVLPNGEGLINPSVTQVQQALQRQTEGETIRD